MHHVPALSERTTPSRELDTTTLVEASRYDNNVASSVDPMQPAARPAEARLFPNDSESWLIFRP